MDKNDSYFKEKEIEDINNLVNTLNKLVIKKEPKFYEKPSFQMFLYSFWLYKYFDFIPNDSSNASIAKAKLSAELKMIMLSSSAKTILLGSNILYFLMLINPNKSLFSMRMINIIFGSLTATYFINYYYHSKVLLLMNKIFEKDIYSLQKKMKTEEKGLSKEV